MDMVTDPAELWLHRRRGREKRCVVLVAVGGGETRPDDRAYEVRVCHSTIPLLTPNVGVRRTLFLVTKVTKEASAAWRLLLSQLYGQSTLFVKDSAAWRLFLSPLYQSGTLFVKDSVLCNLCDNVPSNGTINSRDVSRSDVWFLNDRY